MKTRLLAMAVTLLLLAGCASTRGIEILLLDGESGGGRDPADVTIQGSWHGIEKLRADWNERWPEWAGPLAGAHGWGLAKDGTGHVVAGAVTSVIPAATCQKLWTFPVSGAVLGVVVEVAKALGDDTFHLNLLDRIKDVTEYAIGATATGLISRAACR